MQNRSVAVASGMMARVRLKMAIAFRNAVICKSNNNEIRRMYWIRIAEKWMEKQTEINRRCPELLQ